MWSQGYNPLGTAALSTAVAILPILVLLGGIGWLKWKAHNAAMVGLATALGVALLVFRLPLAMAGAAVSYGLAYGVFPVGWIILNALFLFRLTDEKGLFKTLRESLTHVAGDRRLQILLIAFAFSAFMEGVAGLGTPVPVCAAIMMGLGFPPLSASLINLVGNTLAVPAGSVAIPLITLQAVTNLDMMKLTLAAAWQLLPFAIILPFWMVWIFAGFKRTIEVLPAILVAGISYGVTMFTLAKYQGPWLLTIGSSIVSMAALVLFFRIWKPSNPWTAADDKPVVTVSGPAGAAAAGVSSGTVAVTLTGKEVFRAWTPWIILAAVLIVTSIPAIQGALNAATTFQVEVPFLHNMVQRTQPAVAVARLEPAIFKVNWLTACGSMILIASIVAGFVMGASVSDMVGAYKRTFKQVRFALLTIAMMMGLGYTTRYAGMDATIGLVFARTGALYPFFAPFVGWVGVASTGSATSSNALFGSLQRITAENLGFNVNNIAAANCTGGLWGKMISPQSIVLAATGTNYLGHENEIMRGIFWHSVAAVVMMGAWIYVLEYLAPFSSLIPR
jgi:lactate permease